MEVRLIIDSIPKVENMQSSSGKDTPNQFIIRSEDYTLFQSYRSPIAMFKGGKTYIFKNWDYSTTTGKYRNRFLNETKKETTEKLKSGEYIALGMGEAALGEVKPLYDRQLGGVEAQVVYVRALRLLRRHSEALSVLEKVLHANPNHLDFLCLNYHTLKKIQRTYKYVGPV
jgi:hypothetical protein